MRDVLGAILVLLTVGVVAACLAGALIREVDRYCRRRGW
jgi:hypothetical protein